MREVAIDCPVLYLRPIEAIGGHSPGSDLQKGPSGGGGGERSERWGEVGERSERWGVLASEASGGGASERSELTAEGLAVAAEGSGLRVMYNF